MAKKLISQNSSIHSISLIKNILRKKSGFTLDEKDNEKINPFQLTENYEISLNSKSSIYTPKSIARKMVAVALKNIQYANDKKAKLENFKLIDLSCGTGNFFIEILESLLKLSKLVYGEYKYIDSWITGYDIDEKALKICKIRIRLLLLKYGIKSKDIRLQKQNSLLKEYDEKYDLVIGNPPYIGEKNNRVIFTEIKETEFGKKYYEGKMDYFYFFVEKGLDILKEDGLLVYITTNYWLKADYASKLRKKVKEESKFVYVNDLENSVFKNNLGQHNMIYALIKNSNYDKNVKIEKGMEKFEVSQESVFDINDNITFFNKGDFEFFTKKFEKNFVLLDEIANVNQGIVSGCDAAFVLTNEFITENRESAFIRKSEKYLKPFFKSKDIGSYSVKNENSFNILYIKDQVNIPLEIKEYMQKYMIRLDRRREVQNGVRKWYELQWGRDEEIFKCEKIVGRQRGSKNLFAYSDSDFYGSADIYYITKKVSNSGLFFDKNSISLYYILGYLNSDLFYKWFYHYGKRKGEDLELYATPLKNTPIPYTEDIGKINYIEGLVKKQILLYNENIQEEINRFYLEL